MGHWISQTTFWATETVRRPPTEHHADGFPGGRAAFYPRDAAAGPRRGVFRRVASSAERPVGALAFVLLGGAGLRVSCLARRLRPCRHEAGKGSLLFRFVGEILSDFAFCFASAHDPVVTSAEENRAPAARLLWVKRGDGHTRRCARAAGRTWSRRSPARCAPEDGGPHAAEERETRPFSPRGSPCIRAAITRSASGETGVFDRQDDVQSERLVRLQKIGKNTPHPAQKRRFG